MSERLSPRVCQRPGPGCFDRPPDPLGGARHVDVADAEVAEGVDDGVLHRGGGTDRRRFADPLRAERVVGGGGLGIGSLS